MTRVCCILGNRLVSILLLVFLTIVLASCSRTDELNIRIAVYLRIDGKIQVFSEIYSYVLKQKFGLIRGFNGSKTGVYTTRNGEAIVMRSGEDVIFASPFAAWTPLQILRDPHSQIFKDASRDKGEYTRHGARMDAAAELTDEADVQEKYWPAFFAFENLDDPLTAHKVDFQDLSWGAIERVTVQVVPNEADIGDVERVIPWINASSDGPICPDVASAGMRIRPTNPCFSIYKSNLIETSNEK